MTFVLLAVSKTDKDIQGTIVKNELKKNQLIPTSEKLDPSNVEKNISSKNFLYHFL